MDRRAGTAVALLADIALAAVIRVGIGIGARAVADRLVVGTLALICGTLHSLVADMPAGIAVVGVGTHVSAIAATAMLTPGASRFPTIPRRDFVVELTGRKTGHTQVGHAKRTDTMADYRFARRITVLPVADGLSLAFQWVAHVGRSRIGHRCFG